MQVQGMARTNDLEVTLTILSRSSNLEKVYHSRRILSNSIAKTI